MTVLTTLVAIPFGLAATFGIMISLGAILAELRPRTRPATINPVPFVSVIVPAYNEGVVLADCLGSILKSGYPRLELIVVNDGSTDDTAEVMERYSDRACRSRRERSKGSALNVARACEREILFADADGLFV